MKNLKSWSSADALELYNIKGWGQGYFGINDKGNLTAYPRRDATQGIDLKELLEDAQSQGLNLPLLIRFSDILQDRLLKLHQAFENAISEHQYQGGYLGVYPIKVNQQRQVVEEVVRFGEDRRMGLEVGSKPELYAVLATLESPASMVICNGYKDDAYIRLALLAQKLGRTVFLVVEKLGELELIMRLAKEEAVRPNLGIRLKLVTSGSGKWEDSGGDYSKFGLTSLELVRAVDYLKESEMLDCFRLIHTHLGSQVSNIRQIKESFRETARNYAELKKLGCPIDHVDVGGGLGVDYDGTRSTFGFSINYTEQEYANDIISVMGEVCRHESLEHPVIISESGRALTAHHAMLAVNVLETASLDNQEALLESEEEAPELMDKLRQNLKEINARNYYEFWHEALHLRDETHKLFELGYLSLLHKAQAEQIFWSIAKEVERLVKREKRASDEFEPLETLLADKYFCNFSVFQSLPDAWAIGQEFPVVPLHRLNERPTRNAILQDITCDSDGRIQNYISRFEKKETLPLHQTKPGHPYWLGVFLTGAYQEILGDMHNLFGDTNAIHVALDDDGSWHYDQVIQGENVAQVLEYVQFRKDILIDRMERQVEVAIRTKKVTRPEGKAFLDLYMTGLEGYTYLEDTPKKSALRRSSPKSAREPESEEAGSMKAV